MELQLAYVENANSTKYIILIFHGVHPVPKEHNSWLHSVLTHILHSHLDAIPCMITVTIVKVNMKWNEIKWMYVWQLCQRNCWRTQKWNTLTLHTGIPYPVSSAAGSSSRCQHSYWVPVSSPKLSWMAMLTLHKFQSWYAQAHTLRYYRQWHCQFVRITYRYWVLIRLHKYHWYIMIYLYTPKWR